MYDPAWGTVLPQFAVFQSCKICRGLLCAVDVERNCLYGTQKSSSETCLMEQQTMEGLSIVGSGKMEINRISFLSSSRCLEKENSSFFS
jgi:hypothetical protein